MKILAIDVGTGTEDILLYDSEKENNKRSKSPIFKIQSELLYSGNKKKLK